MDGISDIRIVGIDERRMPRIRKEPYIDLFFKLSHKVPVDWCQDFNNLMSKHPGKPRIKEREGLFIDAWVKTIDDIAPFFETLKGKITQCNRLYIERAEAARRDPHQDNDSNSENSKEQDRLNRVIASLDY